MDRKIRDELARLCTLTSKGPRFHVCGISEQAPPRLHIEGVGELEFPISGAQARALRQVASPAPYGRGEQTLVDPKVRRTSQISAESCTLRDAARWEASLDQIVSHVQQELGITTDVRATLYKMLVYEEGDFFLAHRDSEKEEGMFATLVITLPSCFEGGELVISHDEERVEVSTRLDAPDRVHHVAFYADCLHELRPLRSGHRVALLYNLAHTRGGSQPVVPITSEALEIRDLLRAWKPAGETRKFVMPLAHRYTLKALSFNAFKGEDRHAFGVMRRGATLAGFELWLGMMYVAQRGLAIEQYVPRSRRRWGYEQEPEYEDDEVHEEQLVIEALKPLDPLSRLPLDRLPFTLHELIPSLQDFDELPFDEREVHEATGNEGASFERSYRRAALVFWPEGDRVGLFAQLSQPDLFEALEAGSRDGADYVDEVLLGVIDPLIVELEALDDDAWTRYFYDPFSRTLSPTKRLARLITLGASLIAWRGDATRLHRLIDGILTARPVPTECIPALYEALGWLEEIEALDVLYRVAVVLWERAPDTSGKLLAHVQTQPEDTWASAALHVTCQAIVERPMSVVRAQTLEVVLGSLLRVQDEELVAQAARHLPVSRMCAELLELMPDMLAAPGASALAPLVEALRPVAAEYLGSPPAKPLDWAKESPLSKYSKEEREVTAFLHDPKARTYELRALKRTRQHIESELRRTLAPDVSFETIKKGSPHALKLTKHHARHAAAHALHERQCQILCDLDGFLVRVDADR